MKEQKAENDALVAFLSNPNANIEDYLKHGITADNTLLLTPEEYKQKPLIKKQFTDEKGVFNEGAFQELYNKASEKYFELTDEEAFQNLLKYSPTSRYKPIGANTLDTNFQTVKNNNPTRISKSLVGLNTEGQLYYTEEELAQMGKIWDSKNKKWKEGTAESLGLLDKLFGETLVYAQYEKDGIQENPITGKKEYHKAGEWMTDEYGDYFTMTLSGDLGAKRVVSVGDILTREGSILNKLDFFDSDGYNKSAFGTLMKSAVTIFPYLIPGVNAYYGALTAAFGLASVMPTFSKALDGLVTGGDNESYTTLTSLENWFRKFTPSKSRHGQESFFSFESIGGLLADTFGQLHLLLAAAKLATYFKKAPEINKLTSVDDFIKAQKSLNQSQSALALGYMGLISSADVYNDAIQGGYDPRTAGLAALGTAGALFGIMNFNETANGLGTWFLKKSTGYEQGVTKAPLIKIAKQSYKDAEKALNEIIKTGNPQKINKYFGNFWANAKDKMQDVLTGAGEGIWKSMIVEGVEEVSEEVVQDMVKGIVDALSAMGYTSKRGSFGGWDNVFSAQGLSRYFQTLVGGALGGAVFDIQQNKLDPWIMRTFKDPNYKTLQEIQAEHDIIDIIFEGRTNELIKEVEKLKKVFNTKKGVTLIQGENGQMLDFVADGQKTQADAIADTIIHQIQEMDTFIKGRLGIKDFGSISSMLLQSLLDNYGELFRTELLKTYLQNVFKDNLKKMWDAYSAWRGVSDFTETKESENKTEKEASSTETKVSKDQLKAEFEYYLNKCKGMFGGEEQVNTLRKMQLLSAENLKYIQLSYLDKDTWYNLVYKNKPGFNTDYNQLPEGSDSDPDSVISKKSVDRAYEAYQASQKLDEDHLVERVDRIDLVYMALQKTLKPDIDKWVKSEHKKAYLKTKIGLDDIFIEEFGLKDESTEVQNDIARQLAAQIGNISKIGEKNPLAFTLDDRVNFNIADKLISSGVIDLSDYTEAQQKVIKSLINWNAATSGLNSFNKQSIEQLIVKSNRNLSDSTNIYKLRVDLLEAEPDSKSEEKQFVLDAVLVKSIKTDFSKVDKDFALSKEEDYAKILGEGEISPEVYRMIVNYAAKQITDFAISLDSNLDQTKIFNLIKEYLLSPGRNILIDDPKDTTYNIAFLEDSNLDSINTDKLQSIIENIQKTFGNHEVVETNPLRQAIEKIYFQLHGSTEGSTIFDWLFKKETELQTSDFTGDTFSLTESDRRGLDDALRTIDILNYAIQGMYVGSKVKLSDDFEIEPRNINAVQILFLDSYKDGKGKEDYLVLDIEDFDAVSDYIAQVKTKLETIKQIDSELTKSKSQYYDGLRKSKNAAHRAFFNSNFLRQFKMEDDKDPIDLLEGFEPDVNLSDEDYCRQAREIIVTNIRKLYDNFKGSFKNGEKDEAFIKQIVNGVKNSLPEAFGKQALVQDGIPSWSAIVGTIDDNGGFSYINGKYIIKELVKSIYVSPKDEYDLLDSIYSETDISPRVDQEEALVNLKFTIDHQDIVNKIEKITHDLYTPKEYQEMNVINKSLLSNVSFLLGSGGSGKTLLMSLISKHLGDNKKVLVSAMILQKVDDLKSGTKRDGKLVYEFFSGLEELDKTFKSHIEGICKELKEKYDNAIKGNFAELKVEGVKFEKYDAGKVYGLFNKDGLKFDFSMLCGQGSIMLDHIDFKELPKSILLSGIDANSVLMVDECTQLSPLAQFAISTLAKDNNITVIEVGDPVQPGWTYTAFDSKRNEMVVQHDLSEYQGNIIGTLAGVWRAENDSLQDTITKLYTVYTTPQGLKKLLIFSYSDYLEYGPKEYNENIGSKVASIDLTYTLNNDKSKYSLLGTVYSDNSNVITDSIKKAESVDTDSRVIIIPNNMSKDQVDFESLLADSSKWKVMTVDEVQGSEFDYTLLYNFKSNNSGIIEQARLGFMCLTRAKRGTIIDTDSNGFFESLGFKFSKVDNKIREYQTESKDRIATERLALIKQLKEISEEISPVSKISIPPTKIDKTPQEEEKESEINNSPMPVVILTDSDDISEGSGKSQEEINEVKRQITRTWRNAFGEDFDISQLEPWYNRLGLTEDELSDLGMPVKEWWNNYKTKSGNNLYEDFPAFLRLVDLGKLSDNDLKNADWDGGINNFWDSLSLQDAIKVFVAYKTYLVEHLSDYPTFIRKDKEKDAKNKAQLKNNDSKDENGNVKFIPLIRGGVWFLPDGDEMYYFTCGTFPTNIIPKDENGELVIVSKTIDDLKEGQIIRFDFKNAILEEEKKKYNEGLNKFLNSREDGLTYNSEGVFSAVQSEDTVYCYSQGSLQLRIKNMGINNIGLTHNEKRDVDEREIDLKYGRAALRDYLDTGYVVMEKIPEQLEKYCEILQGLIKLKGGSESLQKENFKKIALYLRLFNFKEESEESKKELGKFLALSSRKWIFLRQKGSNIPLLCMVSRTVESFNDSLNDAGYTESSSQNLTAYKHYVLLERICKTLDESKKIEKDKDFSFTKTLNEIKDLLLINNKHEIDLGKLEKIKNFLMKIQTSFDSIKTLTGTESNLKSQLKFLCNSYLIALQRKSISKHAYFLTDKQLDFERLRKNHNSLHLLMTTGDLVTKNNINEKIGSVIEFVDKHFPNYFYDNTKITNVNDPDSSVKIERIYEHAPIFFPFSILHRADENAAKERIASGDPALPLLPIEEINYVDIVNEAFHETIKKDDDAFSEDVKINNIDNLIDQLFQWESLAIPSVNQNRIVLDRNLGTFVKFYTTLIKKLNEKSKESAIILHNKLNELVANADPTLLPLWKKKLDKNVEDIIKC